MKLYKSSTSKNEKEIHRFLINNYWLLGIEYFKSPIKSQIDELGKRIDKEVLQTDGSRPDIIIYELDAIEGGKTV